MTNLSLKVNGFYKTAGGELIGIINGDTTNNGSEELDRFVGANGVTYNSQGVAVNWPQLHPRFMHIQQIEAEVDPIIAAKEAYYSVLIEAEKIERNIRLYKIATTAVVIITFVSVGMAMIAVKSRS